MKTIRGSEIVKLLPDLDKAVADKLRLIGKFDGVNVLLRLDDAWENFSLDVYAHLHEPVTQERNTWDRAVYRYSLTMRALIQEGLQILLDKGPDRRRFLFQLPEFDILISNNDSMATLAIGEREGVVVRGFVYWMTFPINLAGQLPSEGLLAMQPPEAETKFFAIDLIWEWLRLLHSRRVAKMALAFKTGLVVREDREFDFGRLEEPTKLPDLAEALSQDGFDMRSIIGGARAVDAWNSDLRSRITEGLPTLKHGIDSEENVRSVDRQIDATKEAYSKLPGFEEIFFEHYGHSLTEFVEVCRSLLSLARQRIHSVYCDRTETLQGQLAASVAGIGNSAEIVTSMTRQPRTDLSEFPIINVEGYSIFQFGRVLSSLTERAQVVYDDVYNNSPKGEAFEVRCRALLSQRGFETIPNRVPIPSGFSPKKDSTDVDVIAKKGRFVLLLECKAEKFRLRRGHPSNGPSRMQNRFLAYSSETYERAAWLSNKKNRDVLPDANASKILSDGQIVLIPLVVTTYPVTVPGEKQVGIITLAELERLALDLGDSRVLEKDGQRYLDLSDLTVGGEARTIILSTADSYA